MKDFRFRLDTSSRKYTCPSCGKKRLVRFMDSLTGELTDEQFGRCDREVNCGYFMAPSQTGVTPSGIIAKPAETALQPPPDIPLEVMRATFNGYEGNYFTLYLSNLLGLTEANRLIARYYIGTSFQRWPGASVFWFIDYNGRIRCGQVKLFKPDGHTAKFEAPDGELQSCTSWIHRVLDREYRNKAQPAPLWLRTYLDYPGTRINCLFGEHLLKLEPSKPVAIVEAPATAIVASAYLPEFVWVASGSLSYLTKERCKALRNRDVVVFPDISKDGRAFNLWSAKAKEIGSYARVTVSDYLEKKATKAERVLGLDLRDYLSTCPYNPKPEANYINLSSLRLCIEGKTVEIKECMCNCIIQDFQIFTFRITDGRLLDCLFDKSGEPLIIDNPINYRYYSSFFLQPMLMCRYFDETQGLVSWTKLSKTI